MSEYIERFFLERYGAIMDVPALKAQQLTELKFSLYLVRLHNHDDQSKDPMVFECSVVTG